MLYPGGNAVNVLCTGVAVAPVSRRATSRARAVLDALVAEGVDTSLLVVEGPNAYADVRVVGNRVFDHGDPGVSRFALTPADFAAVAAASIVHTGKCSMVEEQLADLSAAAPRLSFDFSERPDDYIAAYAPLVDIAIRSLPCATREDAAAEAHRIQALGPDLVAVTMARVARSPSTRTALPCSGTTHDSRRHARSR